MIHAESEAFAGTLSAALDKDSVLVKNFKKDLMKTDPTASTSGYKLLHAILSSEECGDGIYRLARIDDFNKKDFFAMASTPTTHAFVHR